MASKKSSAKAAGVKSTFLLGEDNLLITSFGKGNAAVREKYVDKNNEITDLNKKNKPLTINKNKNVFNIKGRAMNEGVTDDPRYGNNCKLGVHEDQIHLKSKLEMQYYGKTFSDNIHIQLIYCILDIEKILAVHINNVIYQLNNIMRDGDSKEDVIGNYLNTKEKYLLPYSACLNRKAENARDEEEKATIEKAQSAFNVIKKLVNTKQIGYYGDVLFPYKNGKKLDGDDYDKHLKRTYYLIYSLGFLRQATAHGGEYVRGIIYNFDKATESAQGNVAVFYKELREELDKMYAAEVDKLNNDFLQYSAKDIQILCKLFPKIDKTKLIQRYYGFIVKKTHKNIGISIKKIREALLENDIKYFNEKKYDSLRHKLNHMLDFIIYRDADDDKEHLETVIDELRASQSEEEKKKIYLREAKRIYMNKKDVFVTLSDMMNGDYIKNLSAKMAGGSDAIEKGAKVNNKGFAFSEMIYLLTRFLDGKEINDLLTQLIHKTESIYNFAEVMKQQGIENELKPMYAIFTNEKRLAGELRAINSFARMTKENPSVKKTMFVEAAQLLGCTGAEQIADEIFEQEQKSKKDNNLRNFIINNVIESTRFKYLVRYSDPKSVRKIAENEQIITFALRQIPDEQIVKFYNSCNGLDETYDEKMRDDLKDKIAGLKFEGFKDVQQNSKDIGKQKDKEKKKNIVRLYLTVLYLIVKNLVYVNSRYYLAFHCAERDSFLYFDKEKNNNIRWMDYTRKWLDEYSNNWHAKNYINVNIANSSEHAIRIFRNITEHLNTVRNVAEYAENIKSINSYFELYHYVEQKIILDQLSPEDAKNQKMFEYKRFIEGRKTYCKDMVKALNVPFAYNLARYKNLSIEDLFDRNNYLPNKAKEWIREDNADVE